MQQLYDESQARRFLAAAIAWPNAEIDGVFNVVTKTPPTAAHKKPFWNHIGVKNLDDAIKAIVHQIAKRGATEIYGWMGLGLPNASTLTDRPGSWYKGNRQAENAAWFKSIFLDLDYGPTKQYPDRSTAQQALADFLSHAKLAPPNIVVATGHGFHCHWTMTDPIPPERWQDLSSRLVSAINQHGLHCDTQVTIDRARILRVPGTWNNKEPKAPVKVELIRERPPYFEAALVAALAPYAPHVPDAFRGAAKFADGSAIPFRPAVGDDDALVSGIEQSKLEVDIDAVANECPLIADALATEGRDHANPLWHQLIYMSTFCKDGPELAHDLSRGHATYSEEETDAEYQRELRTRAARPELGWAKCKTLHDAGGQPWCKACPHLAEGKSPFNYFTGNPATPLPPGLIAVAADSGFLPDRYVRDKSSRVCLIVSGEEGEPPHHQPINDHPLFTGYLSGPEPEELHFSFLNTGNSGVVTEHRARLELTTLGEPKQWRSRLHGQGLMVHQPEIKPFGDFLMSWSDTLRRAQESVLYDAASFGWVEHLSQMIGFAYDGVTWGKNPRPAPVKRGLSVDYTPKGTIEPWKKATKLVTDRQSPELEILLAVAFAAPLVELLGDTAKGIQIFAWSHGSGAGKTTALSLAASVWGHPLMTMLASDDTNNVVDKKMGDLKNLPLIWDEFKTASQTDNFINMIFRASGGKGKARLSSDVSYRAVGNWSTILVCASNAPMLDRVYKEVGRTNAGALRVFEYEIAPNVTGMIEQNAAAAILDPIKLNYGNAGRIYAKWLGENVEAIRDDLHKFRRALVVGLENPAQERFWSAAVTILVKGAQYAKQLGLVDFHPHDMLRFCKDLVGSMRTETFSMTNPLESVGDLKGLLTSFRADMLGQHTIKFDQIFTAKGRPPANFYQPKQYNAVALRTFEVTESDRDNFIRFTHKALSDWLAGRKLRGDSFGAYSANEIAKALEKKLGARILHQGRLAPGFDKDVGEQKIIEISTVAHPDLKSTFT